MIILAGLMWLASYQIGLARNLRYRQEKLLPRIGSHLTLLVITPITGLCETIGPFIAVLRWLVGSRNARWTPTPKLSDRGPAPADSADSEELLVGTT